MDITNTFYNSYLCYLAPLIKWRVMDLKSLREESFKLPNYSHYCRIIRKLEQAKLISSFRHPFNKRKYVYLEAEAEKELKLEDHPPTINKETLIHDITVSIVAREFLKRRWVDEVFLEHELTNKRSARSFEKVIPDASLKGRKNKIPFSIALEVELSRKCKQRVINKIVQFSSTGHYDYVLFLFSNQNLMNSYREIISGTITHDFIDRIMYFFNPNIFNFDVSIGESIGYVRGVKKTINDIFLI